MNNKPEIREPESDGIVLDACLALPDGLRHRHAKSVLEKYSNPDKIADDIKALRGRLSNVDRQANIQQILHHDVELYGSEEERLALDVELFDENEPNSSNN